MPTLFSFDNFRVRLYYGDHGIPHIHLMSADCNASIAIETGEVIVGDAPAYALAITRKFIAENRDTLLAEWRK